MTSLALLAGLGLGPGAAELSGKAAMASEIGALEQDVASLEAERDEANRRREAAAGRLVEAEKRLRQATLALSESEAALEVALKATVSAERAQRALAVEADEAAEEVVALQSALGAAEARQHALEAQIVTFGDLVDDVIEERDFALARGERLRGSVGLLENRLAAANDREQLLIAELSQAAEASLDGLESIFKRADLDLESIVKELGRDYAGQGGPFKETDASVVEDIEIAALTGKLERVNLMQFAATKVPFALPVVGGRLTSAYGPRRDPFRRKQSMHEGIDIAAPHGTPILATAEGIVTFVGRQRGYGIVVEIRHAFGFETLYAHMSKARVTLGQRVERGTLIGDMGSTGRSTGNHVHYEVRINSKAVNPMKFIEAARDVL